MDSCSCIKRGNILFAHAIIIRGASKTARRAQMAVTNQNDRINTRNDGMRREAKKKMAEKSHNVVADNILIRSYMRHKAHIQFTSEHKT